MKYLVALAAVMLPIAAVAQQPQASVQQQLDSIVATNTAGMTAMRSQILTDQAQIADLQRQLDEAKKSAPSAPKP